MRSAQSEPAWVPTARYVAPFGVFVLFLGLHRVLNISSGGLYVARFLCVTAALLLISRPVIPTRPRRGLASVVLGVAVFALWIAPDAIWPGYRHHWLFSNALTGSAESSVAPVLRASIPFAAMRTMVCSLLVPILEELFWRGWMLRWFVRSDFQALPMGTATTESFWVVAVLFASEHGPYWDVGLVAGIAYNWWMMRTRSLADCILAHAVTNLCLSVYVLATGHWQYWL